ncbi:MAG: hypothetical protein CVU55_12790 [Deltaproteobacteria bacterium HGW-Deltaproteobacteria-13]|jgi:hypothetical protein|nr:MAG: hypothetical protein CVU55_12790 [Deltaproteobacteria bacterium HGW-Deltaproteobacteria-13]
MKRCHAFEFNDYKIVPEFIRESMPETLGMGLRWSKVYKAAAPYFITFLKRTKAGRILDLASGSGEPVSVLLESLKKEEKKSLRIILSDLYPNIPLMSQMARRHPDHVSFIEKSLDATDIPDELDHDARLIITAFHHFPPERAARMLGGCVEKRSAIFILEPITRSLSSSYKLFFFVFMAILCNPWMAQRHRLLKIIFTFFIPIIPCVFFWDSLISLLRIYTKEELTGMTAFSAGTYHWEYHEVPVPWRGRIQIYMGFPK